MKDRLKITTVTFGEHPVAAPCAIDERCCALDPSYLLIRREEAEKAYEKAFQAGRLDGAASWTDDAEQAIRQRKLRDRREEEARRLLGLEKEES